ncbi:MAG TPA: hypothetical protein VFP87_04595 [Chitinophagaceae bacterium]|nr:hypothetical protein [Chitinophagaceae bacterium]
MSKRIKEGKTNNPGETQDERQGDPGVVNHENYYMQPKKFFFGFCILHKDYI